MRKIIALTFPLLLTGCFDDKEDLVEYIEQVKNETPQYVEPMPEVPQFSHYDYSAEELRSPFAIPKPEAIQEKLQQIAGCLSPDPRRRKQPLEKYALADLTMRGTLGELGVTWALIEASDHTLHRVSVGQYLGLYNGRVTEVNQNNIKVLELIPDGSGCWVERETTIAMVDAEAEGQRK
jgi:type IV pilus assembly protein PilP